MQYQWDDTSAIQKIEIHTPKKARFEAIIFAQETASPESLAHITQRIKDSGLDASPDIVDGEHVLKIRGEGSGKNVLEILRAAEIVTGTPRVSKLPPKPEDHKSFVEHFKQRTLSVAGIFYIIGDVALMAAGQVRARRDSSNQGGGLPELGTGLAFGVSDVMMALYGRPDMSRELNGYMQRMHEYLEAEGISLPKDNALTAEAIAKSGVLHKIDGFIHKQLIPIKSVFEIVGGSLYIKAGKAQNNPFKMASGAFIITGFLTALLVKQKDPNQHKSTGDHDLDAVIHGEESGKEASTKPKHKRFFEWVQEKPLRVTGPVTIMNNAALMLGAYMEDRKYGMSGKDPITGTKVYTSAQASAQAALQADIDRTRADFETYNRGNPDVMSPEYKRKLNAMTGAVDKRDSLNAARAEFGFKVFGKNVVPSFLNSPYKLNLFGTGVPFLIANTLLGMSDSDVQGKENLDKELNDLYTLGAYAYAGYPPEFRGRAIGGYAGFMARELGFKKSAQEISEKINEKIMQLSTSPWIAKVSAESSGPSLPGMTH